MLPVTLLLALGGALLPGTLAQPLNKSYAYPLGLGSSFVFTSGLPARFSLSAPLPSIPPQCQTYATGTNSDGSLYCDPAKGGAMQALNLTLQDCAADPSAESVAAGFNVMGAAPEGGEWTVCRCTDAPNTFEVLARQFARLPVNLRDYVRYLVAFNGPDSAFSTNGDMVLFGDESTEAGLTVLIHESHHDIDQGTSASSAWTEAITADSCVPDPYAATNAVEDFAQVGVVHLYLDIFGTPPGGVDLSCMSNQLAVFDANTRLNAAAMGTNAAGSTTASFPECDLSVRAAINNPPSRRLVREAMPRPTSTAMPTPAPAPAR